MSDNDKASFIERVIWVVKGSRERIIEYGVSLLQRSLCV